MYVWLNCFCLASTNDVIENGTYGMVVLTAGLGLGLCISTLSFSFFWVFSTGASAFTPGCGSSFLLVCLIV